MFLCGLRPEVTPNLIKNTTCKMNAKCANAKNPGAELLTVKSSVSVVVRQIHAQKVPPKIKLLKHRLWLPTDEDGENGNILLATLTRSIVIQI